MSSAANCTACHTALRSVASRQPCSAASTSGSIPATLPRAAGSCEPCEEQCPSLQRYIHDSHLLREWRHQVLGRRRKQRETRGEKGGGGKSKRASTSFMMQTTTCCCGAGELKAAQVLQDCLPSCRDGHTQTIVLRAGPLYRHQLSRLQFRWVPLSLIEAAAQWPGLPSALCQGCARESERCRH